MMMKKMYSFTLIFFMTISAVFAQKYGNLTVFSEDGDKFFLILNGEKQNEIPQTNIRIEELNQPYYSARVIFEDKALQPITKNNLMIQDAEGVFVDVTYKIKKDKNNKVKLNYYSQTAVQPDFIPPSGMYVRHFGQSEETQREPNTNGSKTTTTTTKTTTTTSNNDNIGASINMPGMNMSISISDPDLDAHSTVTNTTTTHHSSSTHTSGGNAPKPKQQQQQYTGNCKGWPMSTADFNSAKNTIDESSFDDTKLSTSKSIATTNCLTTDQIIEICKLFSFEENKLAFAKFAYKATTDPKNYFKVNTVFNFSASKDELNRFIQGQ